jgi:hypothetical protein
LEDNILGAMHCTKLLKQQKQSKTLPPYSTNALALSTPAKQKQILPKTVPSYSTNAFALSTPHAH